MQKPVSQQGWEQKTSSKFGTSEQFHPIPTLQNTGTEFVAQYALKGGYMSKLDLKDVYFCDPLKRDLRKYV